jgi:CBS domain-containing protein
MMGAALGGIEGMFLPHFGGGFWALVGIGAILGGTMRSPFTGIVFALELTHDFNMLLPLMVASFIAHGFTVLTLKRSILTEKISRRGYHLSREYSLDPFEILFVKEVMSTNVVALPGNATVDDAHDLVLRQEHPRGQHLFPVVDAEGDLLGVLTRMKLAELFDQAPGAVGRLKLAEIAVKDTVVAFADEPLRVVVHRMAESGFTRLPVLDPLSDRKLVGMISLDGLLSARSQNLTEERARERVLRIRLPFGRRAT